MLLTRVVATAAVLSSFAGARDPHAGADRLRFDPDPEVLLAKSFRTEGEVVLDEVAFRVNGETADGPAGLAAGAVVSFGTSLECTDHYVAVDGGRPTALERTFDEIEVWFVDVAGEEVRQSASELVDRTVLFAWDEDREEYAAAFAEGDPDEEGPGGGGEALLYWKEDLDLRALLPAIEVAEGDAWEVSADDLAGVLVPGVDVEELLEWAELPGGDVDAPWREHAVSLLDSARASCTYAGRDEDDRALIALEAELETTFDLAPDPLAEEGIEGDPGGLVGGHLEVSFELEGTCRWDLEANRFEALELEGLGFVDVFAELDADVSASAELVVELSRTATAEPL